MSGDRRKEITHHLTEEELDEKLAEADDDDIVRRISFVKNLYQGDTVKLDFARLFDSVSLL